MSSTGLRDQLQAIYDEHGDLTPTVVVAEARRKSHPLHHRFEWDDKTAGDKYREVQAYDLIRSVKITYRDSKGKPQTVRYWHPVRADTPLAFDPLSTIVDDEVAMQVLLRVAERDWKVMHGRYGHLKEFWDMVRKEAS